MAYVLMLVSMTLTLIQGHSGSADETISAMITYKFAYTFYQVTRKTTK